MTKLNVSKLKLVIFLGIFLLGVACIMSVTNAQGTIPSGGDSVETAVELQPGSYTGGEIPAKEAVFYFVQGKAGQEIKAEGVFVPSSETYGTLVSLTVYNADEEKMIGGDWDGKYTPSVSWLPNSDQETYKHYIKISNDGLWGIKSYTLDLTLTDHYDANSQTDAGNTFGKAMDITAGEYKASLSGRQGTDEKDYYRVAVEKGENLTVKITPPEEAEIEVSFYDSNRKKLKDLSTSNPGEIITYSLPIANNGSIFIAVIRDRFRDKNIADYDLSIVLTGKPVVTKPSEVSPEKTVEQPSGTVEQQPATVNQVNEGYKGEEGTKTATKGFSGIALTNWFLTTLVGLIILVGVMIIIFLLVRKKKNV